MAAFVQSVADADGVFSFASPPASGSIVVVGVGWEGASGTNNAAVLQNGVAFGGIGTRVDNASGDNHAQIFWLIGATTSNSFTFSLPASGTLPRMAGANFTFTAAASLDTQNTGSGSSGTSLTSGSISLDSAAGEFLVVGLGESYTSNATFSAHQINGVNADGSQIADSAGAGGPGGMTLFWRLLSASFSGGTATTTASANDAWICNILALKAGSSGGGGPGSASFYYVGA